jgi:16S rRNA (uracil1498-N3)-methyltransferase
MNRLPLFEHEQIENESFQILDSQRIQHLKEVLKVQLKQELKAVLVGKSLGIAQLTKMDEKSLTFTYQKKSDGYLPLVHLHIGLSRPPTIKKILEHATSQGVASFHFFQAKLSEKSYATSKVFEKEQVEKLLVNGLAQGAISHQLPEVTITQKRIQVNGKKYFFDPSAQHTLSSINLEGDIHFALGPERGWTDHEIEELKQEDWKPINLAPSILRVEIATFAALSQYYLLKGL